MKRLITIVSCAFVRAHAKRDGHSIAVVHLIYVLALSAFDSFARNVLRSL